MADKEEVRYETPEELDAVIQKIKGLTRTPMCASDYLLWLRQGGAPAETTIRILTDPSNPYVYDISDTQKPYSFEYFSNSCGNPGDSEELKRFIFYRADKWVKSSFFGKKEIKPEYPGVSRIFRDIIHVLDDLIEVKGCNLLFSKKTSDDAYIPGRIIYPAEGPAYR